MDFKKRVGRFPCGMCKTKCVTNCLKCSECNLWYHSNCQYVSQSDLQIWGEMDLEFICRTCRTVDGKGFDYLMGIERLHKAASTRSPSVLREAVQREMLFKVVLEIPSELATNMPAVDVTAAQVLDCYVDDISGNPRKTTGDGDCLFNAASILLTGSEALSVCLRYHTCLNLVTKMNEYMIHPLRPSIQRLSCSYESACFSAAKLGTPSCSWTILALADALSRPIRVIYPYANGKNDVAYRFLNTVFEHENTSGIELPILWHRMNCVPVIGEYYEVNHFSAVTDTVTTPILSSTPNEEYSPPSSPLTNYSSSSEQTLKWQIPKRRRISSNSSLLNEETEMQTSNRYEILSDSDANMSDDDDCELGDTSEGNSNFSEANVGLECSTQETEISLTEIGEPVKKPLLNDRFLSNEQIITAVEQSEALSSSIPGGEKNNVYIVMDYSNTGGDKTHFVDDCGVWESGTTVNQYFTVSDTCLTNVFLKKGVFCKRKVVNKKLEHIPLEPQPPNVIQLHRYYAQLKGNKNYRRRISIVSEATGTASDLKMKGVVEYIGERHSTRPSHGNSKSGESYTRTHPAKIRNAAAQVGEKTASQIVDEICKENSPAAPKTAKQVQDRLYYEKKKQTATKSIAPRKNLADDVIYILGELNNHDFIQEVILTKNRPPLMILYNEDQIKNMKANCACENGSVIGVDRTFNMGKFFVTAMSYKSRNVINRKTNQYPIFVGPICLQWDGEQTSYQKFFNHVREKLGSDKLTFGTDDERGLRNALKISFPNSTFLICTKHLKDNIRHQLRKNGTNAHTVQKILESLFSEDSGLVFSRNDDDFAQREDNLSVFFKESPYFRQYYEKYLAEKIKDMIYKPLRDRKITKLWTNNNAESVNNRLKQETQHKILPAPELVQKLSSVVQSQLLNLRRALYGNGNFKLFGKSEKLLIDESVWHEKSHKEKQKQFENLLGMTLGTEPDDCYIRSTDGHIKLKKPRQTAGKKPGQRKRPAAERTTSVRHK